MIHGRQADTQENMDAVRRLSEKGLASWVIAEELGMSSRTVVRYRRRLRQEGIDPYGGKPSPNGHERRM